MIHILESENWMTDNSMAKKKKDKRTNNDLQNITHKTNDRGTRTPLKTWVNSGVPEGWAVPAPLVTPVVLLEYNLLTGGSSKFQSELRDIEEKVILTALKLPNKLHASTVSIYNIL